jgi:hypothetical protein
VLLSSSLLTHVDLTSSCAVTVRLFELMREYDVVSLEALIPAGGTLGNTRFPYPSEHLIPAWLAFPERAGSFVMFNASAPIVRKVLFAAVRAYVRQLWDLVRGRAVSKTNLMMMKMMMMVALYICMYLVLTVFCFFLLSVCARRPDSQQRGSFSCSHSSERAAASKRSAEWPA